MLNPNFNQGIMEGWILRPFLLQVDEAKTALTVEREVGDSWQIGAWNFRESPHDPQNIQEKNTTPISVNIHHEFRFTENMNLIILLEQIDLIAYHFVIIHHSST